MPANVGWGTMEILPACAKSLLLVSVESSPSYTEQPAIVVWLLTYGRVGKDNVTRKTWRLNLTG